MWRAKRDNEHFSFISFLLNFWHFSVVVSFSIHMYHKFRMNFDKICNEHSVAQTLWSQNHDTFAKQKCARRWRNSKSNRQNSNAQSTATIISIITMFSHCHSIRYDKNGLPSWWTYTELSPQHADEMRCIITFSLSFICSVSNLTDFFHPHCSTSIVFCDSRQRISAKNSKKPTKYPQLSTER